MPGILLQLDFEKAFDSISWKFLHKTLEKFNFKENFRHWIDLIYNQPQCCVTNNGYHGEFFTISRGIRQGCPISALLFVLVVEVMAINIRQNELIKGIKLENIEIKLSQLADDTTIFLADIDSVHAVTLLLAEFGALSGLNLNSSKTEALEQILAIMKNPWD